MSSYLLRNGLIADGSGSKGYIGDVLIRDEYIECVSASKLECEDAQTIDCRGKMIAPGFIDCHSHQDHCFPVADPTVYFEPFIRQGITSFVTGNCGFGAAGFKKGSPHKYDILSGFLASALKDVDITWDSWAEYFHHLEKAGLIANVAAIAAHGAALGSILGPGTLGAQAVTGDVEEEVLSILEEGLSDGCKGVSLGLAYRPGNFTNNKQIHNLARLAAKNNKLLTVHRQVETSISAAYGDFNEPHNVRWLREFFENVIDTGVSLHISHLIYPGRSTWPSYEAMHNLIDDFAGKMDITYDMYSYEYGASEVAILVSPDLPLYFDEMEKNKSLHDEKEAAHNQFSEIIGMKASDVFLSNPHNPAYSKYIGMFLDEMAQKRGMSTFDNIVDLYKNTEGHATVMLGTYYSSEMTVDQMTDDKVIYMTDAWIDPGYAQNPAAYGGFPKFLRLARESGNISMEKAVHKMTGKPAKRFDLPRRGFLKTGYFADITVFDPAAVAETAGSKTPASLPIGIQSVFINGKQILHNDQFNSHERGGMVI